MAPQSSGMVKRRAPPSIVPVPVKVTVIVFLVLPALTEAGLLESAAVPEPSMTFVTSAQIMPASR